MFRRINSNGLVAQIKKFVPGIRKTPKGWWTFPRCVVCGRKGKLNFNPRAMPPEIAYRCWSTNCGIKGDIMAFGKLLNKHDIPVVVDIQEVDFSVLEKMKAPQEIESFKNQPVPPEAIPFDKGRYTDYWVKERGFKPETLDLFDLSYCPSGRYAHRVIFPVRTLDAYAFVAYRDNSYVKPKTINAENCGISRFLFPYDLAEKRGAKDVVLVEGITDAMRIIQDEHDVFPLAMLGSYLSKYQLDALEKLNPNSITLCLDSDAQWKAKDMLKSLRRRFGSDIIYQMDTSVLGNGMKADPDSIPKIVFKGLYESRQSLRTLVL